MWSQTDTYPWTYTTNLMSLIFRCRLNLRHVPPVFCFFRFFGCCCCCCCCWYCCCCCCPCSFSCSVFVFLFVLYTKSLKIHFISFWYCWWQAEILQAAVECYPFVIYTPCLLPSSKRIWKYLEPLTHALTTPFSSNMTARSQVDTSQMGSVITSSCTDWFNSPDFIAC